MQKKFGQNFLVNRGARERIVALIGLKPGDRVWEVGPGLGALTHHLLPLDISLTAFEIDHGFIRALESLYGNRKNLSIVQGDFLKTWRAAAETAAPDVVCGNLPYNSASAFLADFAERRFRPRKMVFTIQKEGAERLCAKVGADNYSSFTALCRLEYRIVSEFDLKPGSFWPSPDVTSTVVSLVPRDDSPALTDHALWLRLVRALFATRRKTIANNMKIAGIAPVDIEAACQACGIDPGCRAETLSPERIAELANALADAASGPAARP